MLFSYGRYLPLFESTLQDISYTKWLKYKFVDFSEWIFRCLQPQFPDFSERILLLVKSLVTANKATSSSLLRCFYIPSISLHVCVCLAVLSSKIDSMLQQRLNRFVEKLESKPLDEYFWRDFVELMLQQRSSAFSNFTGNHDTLNMALYLMVCTSTMGWDEAGKEYIQPTLFQSSSELGMAYFLCLLQSLCFTYHIPVCVVLMNVELFYRSSYLRTGGGASFFDSFTHSILKIYPVPHIFATSDALFTLQNFKHIMANSSLGESSSSPEKPTMNEFPSLSMDVEASPLTRIHTSIIQIPEWTKAMARAAFIPSLLDSESLFESIWEAVGGNVKLLEKIASDLRIQKLQLDAEQMKYAHNEKGEEMLLKDVGFDYADLTTKSSFKELLELQKTLKLNALIRNLPEKTLRSDVLQFEWKMNQFFSLKLIEDLRLQMQNSISFYSTVFETIRLLLHQPYTYCQDVEAMKHPIILGLLDVNILTVAFLPTRFSITDRFTYNLLRSYLELHYESLSWRDKMRYTTTTWINRKAYKNALLRLEKSL
ncbi:hypothetical protein IE077_002918 [Cardiosporidium cionae]|uniref:Uncharacterized protein n=1 Tax=Cardiosporidium cionae TaxID=476202 RepID=A0ABQ7J9J8_9APIC|nr:hypothetical protein IE077_002918 [Cardiosporidium cionae]|eukprot:KAF8820688.1 hypothetical protein IE077_002918 [Cardiosporidium cionae]